MKFDECDVRIDIFHLGFPSNITMTHIPSGIFIKEKSSTKGDFRLRFKMMQELKKQVELFYGPE